MLPANPRFGKDKPVHSPKYQNDTEHHSHFNRYVLERKTAHGNDSKRKCNRRDRVTEVYRDVGEFQHHEFPGSKTCEADKSQ